MPPTPPNAPRSRARLLTLVAAACLGSASALAAEPPPPPQDGAARPCEPARPGERFQVDLRDAPLSTLTRLVSCAAGMNFLYQPGSLGSRTVTVISGRSVDLDALVGLLVAAIDEAGLVLERRGAYYLIRPAAGSGATSPPAR